MRSVLNRILASKWNQIMTVALAAGCAGVVATPASAGDRGYGRDRDHRRDHRHDDGTRVDFEFRTGRTDRDWHGPRYEERRVKVWVEPVYRTVTDRVWVEPVYKTVCDRVWREPVVKRECERVWVPDRYESRTVTRVDRHGCRVRVRERVLVHRGHFEERHRDVVVRPGEWETVERQELVCDGHWREVERQELVCAGHYEWRTERVKTADRRWRNEAVFGIGINLD